MTDDKKEDSDNVFNTGTIKNSFNKNNSNNKTSTEDKPKKKLIPGIIATVVGGVILMIIAYVLEWFPQPPK